MKTISIEQLRKWVVAIGEVADLPSDESGLPPQVNAFNYIKLEQSLILSLAATELGCRINEVNARQLPPVVAMCFMAHRPVRSVMQFGNEEEARLAGNNQAQFTYKEICP